MKLTLNQAAKTAHRSKATLLAAIRSGRLSATRDDINQWSIDTSELFRVYPPVSSADLPGVGVGFEPRLGEQDQVQIAALERELENQARTAERERRLLETTIEDLRQDRDHWRIQATHLLTSPQKPKAARAGFLWVLAVVALIAAGMAGWRFWPL